MNTKSSTLPGPLARRASSPWICVIAFAFGVIVSGCIGERVDLWQYNYRVFDLIEDGDLEGADAYGREHSRRARRSIATRYDSLAFAEAAVNLAYARYRLERYDATVRAYDAADGMYHLLPDTLQIRLLRWAAEASRAAGRIERARLLSGRAVQIAYRGGYRHQLELSLACFSEIDGFDVAPARSAYRAAVVVLSGACLLLLWLFIARLRAFRLRSFRWI